MIKTITTIILLLSFLFCHSQKMETIDYQDLFKGFIFNSSYVGLPKRDTIPPVRFDKNKTFSFKMIMDSTSEIYIDKIIIYSADGTIYQEIDGTKDDIFIGGRPYTGYKEFGLIDWNFDGYKDITVFGSCGSGGCDYYIWNYSPEKEKFIPNTRLSGYGGLELDTLNQRIVFHYRFGWQYEDWATYEYQNDELVKISNFILEGWTDLERNNCKTRIVNKLVNNEWISQRDSFIIKY